MSCIQICTAGSGPAQACYALRNATDGHAETCKPARQAAWGAIIGF